MKYTMTGKQMTVRDSLKKLTMQKLQKYDKFFGDEAQAYITFSCKHDLQYVEITIQARNTTFRAEVGDKTFRTALDRAMDALERQFRRNKTRLERRLRESLTDLLPPEEDIPEEEEYSVREKTYPIRPMTLEEAILQMNLLSHTFFVFVDADSGKTCVVYSRASNGYGVIRPEE